MAARRLLAAMLVFLAISTVLAALAPRPDEPDNEQRPPRKASPAPPKSEAPADGDLVRRRVRLEPRGGELQARPDRLRVRAGDQLVLEVAAPRVLTLELASLGITETTGPDDPARIDLFVSGPGRHLMRDAASGRRLLRLDVRKPE